MENLINGDFNLRLSDDSDNESDSVGDNGSDSDTDS